jgi:CBS domain-containing protein
MKRNEPVSHIMTTAPLAVQKGQKLSSVRHLMSEHNIHHVPVVDGSTLVGMISSSDLLRLSWGATDERSLDTLLDHTMSLSEVMTARPVKIGSGQSVREAAELLAEGRFHALPVVGAQDELLGIVTTTDLIRYLLAQY